MENALLAMLGFNTANHDLAQQASLVKPGGDVAEASFAELLAQLTSQESSSEVELPTAIAPAVQESLASVEFVPPELSIHPEQTAQAEADRQIEPELRNAAEFDEEQVGGQVSYLDEDHSEHDITTVGEEYTQQVSAHPMPVASGLAQTAEVQSEPLSPLSEQDIHQANQNNSSSSDQPLVDPRPLIAEEAAVQPKMQEPVEVPRQEPPADKKSPPTRAVTAHEPEIQAKPEVQPETKGKPLVSPRSEMPSSGAEQGEKRQEIAELVNSMNGELSVTTETAPKAVGRHEGKSTPKAPTLNRIDHGGEEPVEALVSQTHKHSVSSEQFVIGRRGEAVLLVEQQDRPVPQVQSDLADKPVSSNSEAPSGGYEQIVGNDLQTEPAQPVRQPVESVVTGRFPTVLEDELVRFSASTTETEVKVIRIKLVPAELGEIQVELRMDEGKILAQINTQQASTRDLVYDNLNQLRSALEAQGIQVSNLVVSHAAASQFAWDGLADRRPQFSPGKREGRKEPDRVQELIGEHQHYHPSQTKWVAANSGFDLRM